VNLGCLTYGPDPSGVVELLRDVRLPTLSVRGNGDRAVLEFTDRGRTPETQRDLFVTANHNEAAITLLRERRSTA
jgi:hypothetical protein